jgi:hypothetical protein
MLVPSEKELVTKLAQFDHICIPMAKARADGSSCKKSKPRQGAPDQKNKNMSPARFE